MVKILVQRDLFIDWNLMKLELINSFFEVLKDVWVMIKSLYKLKIDLDKYDYYSFFLK